MTVERWIADGLQLVPVQRRFLRAAFPAGRRGPDEGVLSTPRGGGKSTLLGHVLACSVTPGAPLFEPGVEN